MRDFRLKSIEAIIQRQQRVLPERDDDCLLFFAENGRPWCLRSGLDILDRCSLAPLQNRFWIDPVAPAQLRGRSLRSLYCCSDCVRGRGAAVTYLAHSASFHSAEKIAPSNAGTEQLAPPSRLDHRLVLTTDNVTETCMGVDETAAEMQSGAFMLDTAGNRSVSKLKPKRGAMVLIQEA